MQVIIPAYKPDERLLTLVSELHEQTPYGIIVVNDGSGEAFDAIFNALPSYVTLLTHEVNKGKGRAMKTAFAHVLDTFPEEDAVVIVDADGQHLIKDITSVLNAAAAYPDALVIGSRKFTGEVPLRSRFGNSLTRHVFRLASGVKLTDTQTGLRAIPLKHLPALLSIKGERYEYEMNMLLRASELGIPMHEVFIETVYIDDNASSHFNVIRDSLKIYAVIFKFIAASFASFLIDYVLFVLFSFLTASLGDIALANLISLVSSRILSSTANYFMNKHAVFKGSQSKKSTIFQYYLLVAVIFGLNYGLLMLFETVLGCNKFLSQVFAMLISYPVSYYLQRMVVFRTRSKKQ